MATPTIPFVSTFPLSMPDPSPVSPMAPAISTPLSRPELDLLAQIQELDGFLRATQVDDLVVLEAAKFMVKDMQTLLNNRIRTIRSSSSTSSRKSSGEGHAASVNPQASSVQTGHDQPSIGVQGMPSSGPLFPGTDFVFCNEGHSDELFPASRSLSSQPPSSRGPPHGGSGGAPIEETPSLSQASSELLGDHTSSSSQPYFTTRQRQRPAATSGAAVHSTPAPVSVSGASGSGIPMSGSTYSVVPESDSIDLGAVVTSTIAASHQDATTELVDSKTLEKQNPFCATTTTGRTFDSMNLRVHCVSMASGIDSIADSLTPVPSPGAYQPIPNSGGALMSDYLDIHRGIECAGNSSDAAVRSPLLFPTLATGLSGSPGTTSTFGSLGASPVDHPAEMLMPITALFPPSTPAQRPNNLQHSHLHHRQDLRQPRGSASGLELTMNSSALVPSSTVKPRNPGSAGGSPAMASVTPLNSMLSPGGGLARPIIPQQQSFHTSNPPAHSVLCASQHIQPVAFGGQTPSPVASGVIPQTGPPRTPTTPITPGGTTPVAHTPSRSNPRVLTDAIFHLMRASPAAQANCSLGWLVLKAVWNLSPENFDSSVIEGLMHRKTPRQCEEILLAVAAVDLRNVRNMSAFLSAVIKEHETMSQVCMRFLAGLCSSETGCCPFVHPEHTIGWNLLKERWNITHRDIDYAAISYLCKQSPEDREAILLAFSEMNLKNVKNLSAYLSRAIRTLDATRVAPMHPFTK